MDVLDQHRQWCDLCQTASHDECEAWDDDDERPWFCGCCGEPMAKGSESEWWCPACAPHVLPAEVDGKYLALWDRTWFAQYDETCPNQRYCGAAGGGQS